MKRFWNWVTVQNDAAPTPDGAPASEPVVTRRLLLNGPIADETWWGDEVTPQIFREELESGNGPIEVWINSYGGEIMAASQIYNMLVAYTGDVTVFIDGVAASAASVIAMAGNTIKMGVSSYLMVHKPSTTIHGNTDDLQNGIDALTSIEKGIIAAYKSKTKLSEAKLSHLIEGKGTWLDAQTALELGFIDEIVTAKNNMGAPIKTAFQQDAVTNSLLDKIAAEARTLLTTPKPTGRKIADLRAKLAEKT